MKYHLNAAEWKAYQKSTHCQNVTNQSSITRHFMIQGNTLQSIGYNQLGSIFVCKQQSARCLNPE